MLKQRILTALVLAAVLFAALIAEPVWIWAVFVSIMIVLGWREWVRLAGRSWSEPLVWFATAALVIVAFLVFRLGFSLPIIVAAAVMWLLMVVYLFYESADTSVWLWRPLSKLLTGVWVLAFAWWGLIWLRQQDNGVWWILGFLMVIWLADTGAYFAGKRFGKRKLAPQVSPGKTFAGLYGGMIATGLYAFIISLLLPFPVSGMLIVLMAIVIGVLSVGGDLFESVLKRQSGLKDSGALLPGHGGVLDRVDSLLAALPFMLLAYALLNPAVV